MFFTYIYSNVSMDIVGPSWSLYGVISMKGLVHTVDLSMTFEQWNTILAPFYWQLSGYFPFDVGKLLSWSPV